MSALTKLQSEQTKKGNWYATKRKEIIFSHTTQKILYWFDLQIRGNSRKFKTCKEINIHLYSKNNYYYHLGVRMSSKSVRKIK